MRSTSRREAFTLVELIVVVTLILFLAGLTARFLPSATTSAREADTAAKVQGWLNMAKQKALRDQASRGLRLWNRFQITCPLNVQGFLVTECEFIELPDPYTSDPIFTTPSPTIAPPTQIWNTIVFQPSAAGAWPALLNGNPNPAMSNQWLVQPGDYICVNGGQMHQIVSLTPDSPVAPTIVTAVLASPFPTPIYPVNPNSVPANQLVPTSNYYIVRGPRPIGEETLQLPLDDATPTALRGVIIDLNTNNDFNFDNVTATGSNQPWNYLTNLNNATPYVDILFTPSGSTLVFVANAAGTGGTLTAVPTGILNLWVRTVDPSSPVQVAPRSYFVGDPTLVSIHLTSGFVGAYSPDPALPNNNPYAFVK